MVREICKAYYEKDGVNGTTGKPASIRVRFPGTFSISFSRENNKVYNGRGRLGNLNRKAWLERDAHTQQRNRDRTPRSGNGSKK